MIHKGKPRKTMENATQGGGPTAFHSLERNAVGPIYTYKVCLHFCRRGACQNVNSALCNMECDQLLENPFRRKQQSEKDRRRARSAYDFIAICSA